MCDMSFFCVWERWENINIKKKGGGKERKKRQMKKLTNKPTLLAVPALSATYTTKSRSASVSVSPFSFGGAGMTAKILLGSWIGSPTFLVFFALSALRFREAMDALWRACVCVC